MTCIRKLLFSLLLSIPASLQAGIGSGSDNFSTGCATVEFMAKMVSVNLLLPAPRDSMSELESMQDMLLELNRLVCQSVILTSSTRHASRYSNGRLVSSDLYEAPWVFPNGQLFMAGAGRDVSIHYPNGRVMSHHWTHGGEPLFWPGGGIATARLRVKNATWFYPDGQIITHEAGRQGGRWFYPFPRLDRRVGQEVISSNWGAEEESFNYLNFAADGRPYMTRERIRRKLSLSDEELLDVTAVVLLITRLYQAQDEARQFVPADANITGAPW
jgi:hypothetical protein